MTHRILVAEDDDSMGALLRHWLEAANYDVTVVTSGVRAVELIGELQPAVVLLDAGLPGVNGLDILRQLRSGASTRTAQVVMLSGHVDQRDINIATSEGANDYLTKPVESRVLLDCVAKNVEASVRTRENSDRLLALSALERKDHDMQVPLGGLGKQTPDKENR